MANISSTDDLYAQLAEFQPKEKKTSSPREERIVEGFAEIQRFVDQHGHTPEDEYDRDIFERLYAIRLNAIKTSTECRELLADMDHQGLLAVEKKAEQDGDTPDVDDLNSDELAAALESAMGDSGIQKLKHVRPSSERMTPEEMAQRKPCEDFKQFKPIFEQVRRDLQTEYRVTRPFKYQNNEGIHEGDIFILSGNIVYVAEVGELTLGEKKSKGERDGRLRVIYDNGTESNILKLSLKRALRKDESARRVISASFGPVFGDDTEEGDVDSGTIYVLRSLSTDRYIAKNRDLIHKIGVTGGSVLTRIANAEKDATYLLADVEVVSTYRLYGINRTKLEKLLHKVFAPAQLNITIEDRFGNPVKPREWFLVPLQMIEEGIKMVRDGSIANVIYDPNTASFK